MRLLALLAVVLVASPAAAQLRELCADRPGLGTPACTVDRGHIVAEVGLADWTLDRQPDMRTDTVVAGDLLVRMGLDAVTEVQLGWTGYGHVRTRDRATGAITRASGVGDVMIGARRSLTGPDGKVAIQPFVTLPTGGEAIGAGDWGAGVLLPFGFDLGHGLALAFTPEIDAAVDQDRSGRHLAYGSVIGLSGALTHSLSATAELAAFRDDDPSGHSTSALAEASLAYQSDANTQFDFGAVFGLNEVTPDLELSIGIARRF